jgi:hypothetical protein
MNIRCALAGHRWRSQNEIRGEGLPWRCERCDHSDDEPGIVRAANRRASFRRWAPLWITVGRKEASVRIGLPYVGRRVPNLSLRVELHYGWERYSGGLGVSVSLHAWRLLAGLRIGGFWHDEDGEGRALLRLWVDFSTYGWRYLPCWLGHKPRVSSSMLGHVYCDRCEESIELADADPRKAVAL